MEKIAVISEKDFFEKNSNIGNKFTVQLKFIMWSLNFLVAFVITGLVGKIYYFNYNSSFAEFFSLGCTSIYFSIALIGAYFLYKRFYFKGEDYELVANDETEVVFSRDAIVIDYKRQLVTEVIPYSDIINYSKSDTTLKLCIGPSIMIFKLSYLTAEQIAAIEECLSEFSEQFATNQKFKNIKALNV